MNKIRRPAASDAEGKSKFVPFARGAQDKPFAKGTNSAAPKDVTSQAFGMWWKRWTLGAFAGAVIFSAGCTRMVQSWRLRSYDKEIRSAAAAIESAKNDAQRAAAYSSRGEAYSEKARYSRVMKLVPEEEYNRLFDLAIQDHTRAIGLQPENAERYYHRGRAYYDRGWLDINEKGKAATTYLALAKADFSATVERNHKNAMAYDMLGLADAGMGDWTQAIADFGQEHALDARASYRVADAYCNRGSVNLGEKKLQQAESDLTRAMEMQSSGDPCECEPYNPLLAIYLRETHEYDKARAVVAKAQAAKKWIAPEYLEQLKASGR